jgi:hypothetical protein
MSSSFIKPRKAVLAGTIRACEQRIFPFERDGTDRTFDDVVVEFDTAIIDKARQTFPA